ncbi:hypothetical protein S83_012647, partial [Arachis hypogaea]
MEDNYVSASDALLAGMAAGFLSFIHSELYICFGKGSPTTFNFKITEWLLSFLRAISGKLNNNTISQLVKTCDICIQIGTNQVLLRGNFNKVSFAIVNALCRRNIQVALLHKEELKMLQHRVTKSKGRFTLSPINTPKLGRKERKYEEAQAVLAAAIAAAASSRVSSFRKDSLDESMQQE